MSSRWIRWVVGLTLLLTFALVCYLRRAVVVSDPYWDIVLRWRGWQQQTVGILHGRWLKRVQAKEWAEVEQELSDRPQPLSLLTPYWRNALADKTLPGEERVRLMTPWPLPSEGRQLQQVSVDQQSLFAQAGTEVASYVSSQENRDQVEAFFYGGADYDAYAQAFAQAFDNAEGQLRMHRVFTSQWNVTENTLRGVEASRVVLVLALGELNVRALELFEGEDNLLFVTEDNRYAGYLKDRMLLSIERNYRGLFRAALSNKTSVPGYLYVASNSPLSERRNRLLKHESKLWQRIVLLWN